MRRSSGCSASVPPVVADRRRADGTGWAVLADPEGNEFCVVRSAGERVATTTVEDQAMSSTIHNISIDCHDTYALAGFWSQVFDCPRQPDDFPGDPEAMLLPPGGPEVLFVAVPEGKTVKNRLHLDLQPADRTRAEEVERLLGIGATLVADHAARPAGVGWCCRPGGQRVLRARQRRRAGGSGGRAGSGGGARHAEVAEPA